MKKDLFPKKGEIIIYQDKSKKASLEVRLDHETVWLNLNQMAELFGRDKSVISRHISNVFRERELDIRSTIAKYATVQKEGSRSVERDVEYFSLDVIISVGYHVKSLQGTKFRIWATNVLREHIIKGVTVNQRRLEELQGKQLAEFEQTLALLESTKQKALSSDEARGLLDIITGYANTWLLLHKYDEETLEATGLDKNIVYAVTYSDAKEAIAELKDALLKKKEAGDLFGMERDHALEGIVGNINQSFGGHALYPTIEEKTAHLLYFVIKDHPFSDGNKRIGSLLFILFLARNRHLYNKKGERKINDNALVALALLVAESKPVQKDVMVKLILNFLKKRT